MRHALLFPARMSLSNLTPSVVEVTAPGSVKFRVLLFLSRCRQEPAVLVTTVTFLSLGFEYAFAPALRNTTPVVVSAFLLCLLLRRVSFDSVEASGSSRLALWRFICFLFLHLTIAGATRVFGGAHPETPDYTSSIAMVKAGCKFIVFLPSAVLLSRSDWQRFGRIYRAECIAAVVALLTFFPNRIVATVWPVYSQVLGHFVHALAGFFVPGLGYQAGAAPTLTGPVLDVEIVFGCSGLDGILLFESLFALLLIMDWDRVQRQRALVGYFVGMASMLLANALRITLMVLLGNRVSAALVVRYHLNAGWIYFTSVFLFYLFVTHRWLLGMDRRFPPASNET
jgi:exosortase/archaeosortase family protein